MLDSEKMLRHVIIPEKIIWSRLRNAYELTKYKCVTLPSRKLLRSKSSQDLCRTDRGKSGFASNIFEPRHEKTCFLFMQSKGADQLRCNRAVDQGLCFRCIDSTIPLLSKSESL